MNLRLKSPVLIPNTHDKRQHQIYYSWHQDDSARSLTQPPPPPPGLSKTFPALIKTNVFVFVVFLPLEYLLWWMCRDAPSITHLQSDGREASDVLWQGMERRGVSFMAALNASTLFNAHTRSCNLVVMWFVKQLTMSKKKFSLCLLKVNFLSTQIPNGLI